MKKMLIAMIVVMAVSIATPCSASSRRADIDNGVLQDSHTGTYIFTIFGTGIVTMQINAYYKEYYTYNFSNNKMTLSEHQLIWNGTVSRPCTAMVGGGGITHYKSNGDIANTFTFTTFDTPLSGSRVNYTTVQYSASGGYYGTTSLAIGVKDSVIQHGYDGFHIDFTY